MLRNKIVDYVAGVKEQARYGADSLEKASASHLDTLSWPSLVKLRDACLELQQEVENEMLGRLGEREAMDLEALKEASIDLHRAAIAILQGPLLPPGTPDPRD